MSSIAMAAMLADGPLSMCCGARWQSGSERRSLNREVLVSNPTNAVLNLGHRLPLPKSLGMLLVYPNRMAVGVKPKEAKKAYPALMRAFSW